MERKLITGPISLEELIIFTQQGAFALSINVRLQNSMEEINLGGGGLGVDFVSLSRFDDGGPEKNEQFGWGIFYSLGRKVPLPKSEYH